MFTVRQDRQFLTRSELFLLGLEQLAGSGDKSCNISVRNDSIFFTKYSSILSKSGLLRWYVAPFLDNWLLDLPWVGS